MSLRRSSSAATDGKATWVTGELQPAGSFVWTGPVYVTAGPYYGGTFDPGLVTARQAGTMTWQLTAVATGTLTYSIDGVTVMKNVVRQNLVPENYRGTYTTAFNLVGTTCLNPAFNGGFTDGAAVTIAHGSTSATMTWRYTSGTFCNLTGTFQQTGRMAQIS